MSGGLAVNNLRGDAELAGQELAALIQSEIGGIWSSEKKSRFGMDLGGGVAWSGTGPLGGAVELRYVTRGCTYDIVESSGSGLNLTATWKLSYVEVPVLLRVSPPTSASVRPVFEIGPVVGFKASADFEIEADGESESVPVGEGFKGTSFAGLVGAGVRTGGAAQSGFELLLRYQLGFTNLSDDSSLELKASGFSILAGWSWALGTAP